MYQKACHLNSYNMYGLVLFRQNYRLKTNDINHCLPFNKIEKNPLLFKIAQIREVHNFIYTKAGLQAVSHDML